MDDAPTPEDVMRFLTALSQKQIDILAQGMAQQMIARAESQAVLTLLEKLSAECAKAGIKVDPVHAGFEAHRRKLIQQALFSVEDKDPTLSALLQKAINESGDSP